jgi:hypothetical protein
MESVRGVQGRIALFPFVLSLGGLSFLGCLVNTRLYMYVAVNEAQRYFAAFVLMAFTVGQEILAFLIS